MGEIKDGFERAWRDRSMEGVASSPRQEPVKAEIRPLGGMIEKAVANAAMGSLLSAAKATRADLTADLAYDAGKVGLVYADETDANNDLYVKTGASGAGGWTLTTILHDVFGGIGQAFVEQAQAWAEGVEPGGEGTKSAKEYAEQVGEVAELTLYLKIVAGNVLAITDASGQFFMSWDMAGRAMFDPSDRLVGLITERQGGAMTAPRQYANIATPVLLRQAYGQSLSIGLGAAGLLTTASIYGNVFMPDHGVHDATWTDAGGAGLTGLESLSDEIVALDGSVNSHNIEAPILGAANQLASRMQCADVLVANAGRGGFGIAGLKKGYNGGAGPYALLIDQVSTYKALLGDRPVSSALYWIQGESDANSADTTINGYKADLLGIRANYADDTGQGAVHLFAYQLASHTMRAPGYNRNVALALGELGEQEADVSIVAPMYFLDYVDGVHLTAPSSRLLGAYFGKADDHWLKTGEKFDALRPTSIARSGIAITIEFHVPIGNLVVDTNRVGDPGHLGFEVFDSVGGGLLTIDAVHVFGNRVLIVLDAEPANPVNVGYALGSTLNGLPAGRFTGARGCLRDEDDTRAFFDNQVSLPNWCLMFLKGEGYGA